MPIALEVNGEIFDYPTINDREWGVEATDWAVAVTSGMLQKAGGLFQLLDDIDFGVTYGLISNYYSSRTADASSVGTLRLANTDVIGWRNAANSANLSLSVSGSDELLFNGNPIGAGVTSLNTLQGDVTLAAGQGIFIDSTGNTINIANTFSEYIGLAESTDSISLDVTDGVLTADLNLSVEAADANNQLVSLNIETDGLRAQIANASIRSTIDVADSPTIDMGFDSFGIISSNIVSNSITNTYINDSAAIVYSKLNLTDGIENADINAAAGIVYSKLSLADSIVNADVNASAAIAYSKLSLSNSIVNADVNTSAAIAYSKLALTNSIVNADIVAAAGIPYSKLTLTNSIVNADVATGAAVAVNKLAALTASRAVVTDGSGFISAATTTATEIGFVNGVTSGIQAQINSRAASVPLSIIWMTGGNGFGGSSSGDTMIRNFTTTVVSIPAGSMSRVVRTTTTADYFLISVQGRYEITYIDTAGGSSGMIGISVNSTQLSTAVNSITNINRLTNGTIAASTTLCINTVVFLFTNDQIRAHCAPTLPTGTTDSEVLFRIIKIG